MMALCPYGITSSEYMLSVQGGEEYNLNYEKFYLNKFQKILKIRAIQLGK